MRKSKDEQRVHEPVMIGEVIDALRLKEIVHLNQSRIIDATVATAGHTIEIVKRGGRVLGIDVDEDLLEVAGERLRKACPPTFSSHERGSLKLVHGNFAKIDEIAKKHKFENVDGILFDLGVSSVHFTDRFRGFSFNYPGAPLDMRLDNKIQKVTAHDLLNSLRKDQLQELFGVVMGRAVSRKLAGKIVASREGSPIETVDDFLKIIEEVKLKRRKLHPATLPFLALRIAVNSELENLAEALPGAFNLLAPGGRLVVISFHSGEDELVKKFFKNKARVVRAKLITKKPVTPSMSETERNPKSRSAKMRVLEKI